MKLLHFALLAPGSPQWGLRNALAKLAGSQDEYSEFDWYYWWGKSSGQDLSDLRQMRDAFLNQARVVKPSFIFLQIQTPNLLPGALLDQIHQDTGAFMLSWCGDLRDETPEWAIKTAPHVSLTCFSNGRDVANLRERGYPAEFLNIGYSTEVFRPDGEAIEAAEIVFLGNNYCTRFPRSVQRQQMVAHLRGRYGSRFAVRGNGWGAAEAWIDEPTEAAIYRGCKIAINQNHYDSVDRFSSDRVFRLMGSGAFCVSNEWPGMEADFTPGKHLVLWHDFDELTRQIDYYLEHEDERKRIAATGCDHVRENHTWDARMIEVKGFIERYQAVAA